MLSGSEASVLEAERVILKISQHAVLRSMHCYKQVTFSTSETPVKEGLQRNYYKTALLSQVAFCSQSNACCEGLFCSRRGTKYHSGDFCGRSRRGEFFPTEYSGYPSAAASAIAAAAAV